MRVQVPPSAPHPSRGDCRGIANRLGSFHPRNPCEPCGFLETIRPGLQEVLQGRRGTLAVVEAGGTLRVGDAVTVLPTTDRIAPHG